MSLKFNLLERLRSFPLFSGSGLKASVFRGGMWLGSGLFAEQTVRFGRNMLLARLLAPSAFGTMAIVTSATSIIHTMMDIGVRDAMVQNPRGNEPEYVNAAWWLSFIRALCFSAVLCTLAPLVGQFYNNRELASLFRVCAIGVIFDGALSAKVYVAIKEMKLKKWAIVNHVGNILGVLITIALSYFIRDVWALVIGYVAESAARCTLSFCFCPFMPLFRWDKEASRDLWKFSKRMFGLSFLNLIFARTDIFVLAKVNTAAELGLYTMAVYLIQTPTSFLMNLLGQTVMPALARIQDDRERINRILLQVTSIIVITGLPALVMIVYCGKSLLTLVYGARYGAASGAFIVAAGVAFLNVLNGQITSVFFAKGRPDLHRFCIIIMAITMTVCIFPFVNYFGVTGGQVASLVAVSIGFALQVGRVHRLTGLSLPRYGSIFPVATGLSVSAVLVCIAAHYFLSAQGPILTVLAGLAGCLLSYSIAVTLYFRKRQLLLTWS